MLPGPISLMREALSNLAAEAIEQHERLSGSVVTDELALDFIYAYEALSSLSETERPASSTMYELRTVYDQLAVASDDPVGTEDLSSERWSKIRSQARSTLARL